MGSFRGERSTHPQLEYGDPENRPLILGKPQTLNPYLPSSPVYPLKVPQVWEALTGS